MKRLKSVTSIELNMTLIAQKKIKTSHVLVLAV